MYLFSSNFNLLVNNNQTLWISGLNIYGSDVFYESYDSTMNTYTFTSKYHKCHSTQDDDPSLESPKNVPPEDSRKYQ